MTEIGIRRSGIFMLVAIVATGVLMLLGTAFALVLLSLGAEAVLSLFKFMIVVATGKLVAVLALFVALFFGFAALRSYAHQRAGDGGMDRAIAACNITLGLTCALTLLAFVVPLAAIGAALAMFAFGIALFVLARKLRFFGLTSADRNAVRTATLVQVYVGIQAVMIVANLIDRSKEGILLSVLDLAGSVMLLVAGWSFGKLLTRGAEFVGADIERRRQRAPQSIAATDA